MRELTEPAEDSAELLPLTLRDDEGRRIYERSLRFVLLLAFRRLMPGQQVRIEYSVGGGVFLHTPGRELTVEDAEAIRKRRAEGCSLRELAREFSLSHSAVWNVVSGRTHTRSPVKMTCGRL